MSTKRRMKKYILRRDEMRVTQTSDFSKTNVLGGRSSKKSKDFVENAPTTSVFGLPLFSPQHTPTNLYERKEIVNIKQPYIVPYFEIF